MKEEIHKTSRVEAFVAFILRRCAQDAGEAARLRRADNPATEYQAWETLAAFNVDIDKPWQRLPFATTAAAIARSKRDANGRFGIGSALAGCYEDGSDSNQAKSKLRRLLACDSVEEVCRILRPLLNLIESRQSHHLDYALLLDQLLKFHWNGERIKARWAQDFYRKVPSEAAS